jgi:DNA-binding transcriptional LysR family regulator
MSDYDQLEFRHLKYIEAVAKTGTITAAAELVNTTQSNISAQIKQIEDIFGIELFIRDNDGATITPFGEIFLAVGRDLLAAREEVIDMVKALRTGKITPLNLGYSSLVEKRTLAETTDKIRRIFPHCEIVTEGDDLPGLESLCVLCDVPWQSQVQRLPPLAGRRPSRSSLLRVRSAHRTPALGGPGFRVPQYLRNAHTDAVLSRRVCG